MSDIKTWIEGKVRVVQLNAEQTLNALDMDMMEDMISIINMAEKMPEIGAVVITGSGRSFCTGADLKAFRDYEQEYIVDYCVDIGNQLFNRIATLKKPVVAAVNGYAMGGGMELALACDFRFGHEKTLFSAPEYGFGWVPGWGGVSRLSRLVGPCKAKEILLFQQKIRGEEALKLGMLNGLYPIEAVLEESLARAEELCRLNPLTVGYTKAIIRDFEVPSYDAYLQGLVNGVTSKSAYARMEIEKFLNRPKNNK